MFAEQRKSYSGANGNWEGMGWGAGGAAPPWVTRASHSASEEESLSWVSRAFCPAWTLDCCSFSVSPTEARTTCPIDEQANSSKGFFFSKLLTSLLIELKNYQAKRVFHTWRKPFPGGNHHWKSHRLGSAGDMQPKSEDAPSQHNSQGCVLNQSRKPAIGS